MENADIIQSTITEYNHTLKLKASKNEQISQLKNQIMELEVEVNQLTIQEQRIENVMQAEIYKKYSKKTLLKMVNKVEKLAKQEVVADFKNLVEKFDAHTLGVNDITQLQTYIKIYGKYVAKENQFFKGIFKALGGETDE